MNAPLPAHHCLQFLQVQPTAITMATLQVTTVNQDTLPTALTPPLPLSCPPTWLKPGHQAASCPLTLFLEELEIQLWKSTALPRGIIFRVNPLLLQPHRHPRTLMPPMQRCCWMIQEMLLTTMSVVYLAVAVPYLRWPFLTPLACLWLRISSLIRATMKRIQMLPVMIQLLEASHIQHWIEASWYVARNMTTTVSNLCKVPEARMEWQERNLRKWNFYLIFSRKRESRKQHSVYYFPLCLLNWYL